MAEEHYIANMGEEERSGYVVSAEMKEVWDVQLRMAVKLLDVCKRYSLKIWAISGTALGAVRHKGFIPWDDDIDFMMFREDYDKLVSVAGEEFKAPMFFQSAHTEEGYYRGHAQLRMDGTTMAQTKEAKCGLKIHQGIFVDIFVADGFPGEGAELEALINCRADTIFYLWGRRYWRLRFSSINYLISYYKAKRRLGKAATQSDAELFNAMEARFKKYKVTDYKRNCYVEFAYKPNWVRETKWFETTAWLPFETIEMPIAGEYDAYLRNEYGDYMTPVRGGTTHGGMLIDTKNDYKDVLAGQESTAMSVAINFVKTAVNYIWNSLTGRNKK